MVTILGQGDRAESANISEILGRQEWGEYWFPTGKPALGYYSHDRVSSGLVWLGGWCGFYNHRQYERKPRLIESGDRNCCHTVQGNPGSMQEMRKGRSPLYGILDGANEHIGWGVVDYLRVYKDETYRLLGLLGRKTFASSYRNTW